MKRKYAVTFAGLVFLVATAISACASLGLSPAQSFDSKLAYAYGVHTAVLQTAAAGVVSHTLTVPDAKAVATLADQSRTLLDSAKSLEASDVTTAAGKLTLATGILTQIQTYLNNRGK